MFNKEDNTQKLTLAEVLRPLAQLCINLAGKNGRNWLEAFKKFLRKGDPWFISRWKVWTVAKTGIKMPLTELISVIKKRGYTIRYSADYSLDLHLLEETLKFNEKEEEIYFTITTPRELGLKPGWTKRKLLDASLKNGLAPCLSGDIIEIIAQSKDQIKKGDDTLTVAMEPITIENSSANFCIGVYDSRYSLGYLNGDLEQIWDYPANVDNKHIFRIQKKQY